MKLDLHLHSNYSDGTLNPFEVIKKSASSGLDCISITDHDLIRDFKKESDFARQKGMITFSGLELSSEYKGDEFHILGYDFTENLKPLEELTNKLKLDREKRAEKIIYNLKKKEDIILDLNMMVKNSESKIIGRVMIAQELKDKGFVHDVQSAFDKYLGLHGSSYVSKTDIEPFTVIEIIKKCGGLPVLAHPVYNHITEKVIKDLVAHGLEGIEVFHVNHKTADIKRFMGIALENGLLVTGGTDWHGNLDENFELGDYYYYINSLEKKRLSIILKESGYSGRLDHKRS